jgi:hypothetical protein
VLCTRLEGRLLHKRLRTKEIVYIYTGHTQKNGAVSKVNSIETAPFFCVCPVYTRTHTGGRSSLPGFSGITLRCNPWNTDLEPMLCIKREQACLCKAVQRTGRTWQPLCVPVRMQHSAWFEPSWLVLWI